MDTNKFLSKFEIIEELNKSSSSEVFLVRDKKTGQEYFCKSIIESPIQQNYHYINQKIRFKKESDIVSSLNHRNISKLSDSFFDETNFYILYTYKKGITLAKIFESEKKYSLKDSFSIIIQLLDALEYIHARGIIHCDINPNNIYITDENELELFDFGLSMTEEEASKTKEGITLGTLPYVSPEQLGVTDFKIDSRTDLYCAALILYQISSGKFPFSNKENTVEELMKHILKTDVKPLKIFSYNLNRIIIKSLKPTPEERYQTATGFKYDLEMLENDHDNTVPGNFIVGEKDSIIAVNREKLFIGRSEEIKSLINGYHSFLKGSFFSALIYGPSGIGKTEIVNKFIDKINEKNIFILSSKCNKFTPNQPFSIFRELLLEIISNVSNFKKENASAFQYTLNFKLHEYSGIIIEVIPEFKPFFDEIIEAGKVNEDKKSERLIHVLSYLLIVICEFRNTIIFIDDFQWIDFSTFQIFKKISALNVKCMVIYSYRTKTSQDELYVFKHNLKDFDIKNYIEVFPFEKNEINELINLRFGDIEETEFLVNSIYERTDNSPFIINEALRYLVNNNILKYSYNGWYFTKSDIEMLPSKFDPVSIILEKVHTLNDIELQFLKLAALVEGKFDRKLIEELGGLVPEISKTTSYNLEKKGYIYKRLKGGYSFTHDKIHEVIFSFLSDDIKFKLYEKLAEIYEKRISENKENIFYAAECYLKTKNLIKSIELTYKAGKYAIEKLAFELSIKYLKRSLLMASIDKKLNFSIPIDLKETQKLIGDIYMLSGQNTQALNVFLKFYNEFELKNDEKLEIKYKVGTIYHNMGDFGNSVKYFSETLKELCINIPTIRPILYIFLIYEIFKQLLFSFGLKYILPNNNNPKRLMIVRILNKLSFSLYYQDMIITLWVHLKALNLADLFDDNFEKGETYTYHIPTAFQSFFLKKRAYKYFSKALTIGTNINRKDLIAFTQSFGGVINFFDGKWKIATEYLIKSINTYKSFGDIWGQIVPEEILMNLYIRKGEFITCSQLTRSHLELCLTSNDMRGLTCGYYFICMIDLLNGKIEQENLNNLKKKQDLYLKNDFLNYLIIDTIFIKNFIYKNDLIQAFEIVQYALKIIKEKKLDQEFLASLHSDFCELLILEKTNRFHGLKTLPLSDEDLLKELYNNCIQAFKKGLLYPAHIGSALRSFAWYQAFMGRKKIAKYLFNKAIKKHHELDMKFEEAKSRKDLGLFFDNINFPGNAIDEFNIAYKLFDQCNAVIESEKIVNKIDKKIDVQHVEVRETRSFHEINSSITNTSEINLLRIETLYDISSSLTAINDINLLLERILEALIKATGAKNGYIMIEKIKNHNGKNVILNFEGEKIDFNSFVFSSEIINWVRNKKIIMLVKDASTDERLNSDNNKNIRSVLCAPIIRGENYIGTVYLCNDRISGLFTIGAEKIASILCAQAGILVENAYIMEDFRNLNDKLQLKVKKQTSDIREKNIQLEDYNMKLLESENMKDLLTGTIVHDIKNYIAGIEQCTKILNKRFSTNEIIIRYLAMINVSCADTISLSSNLLDIGKMSEGKLDIKKEMMTFNQIHFLIKKFKNNPFFEDKNITLEIIPPEFQFEIEVDYYLIERIFQNIFNNASKYTTNNGIVSLKFETTDDDNVIVLFNSSDPIPKEMHNSIFDKYARVGEKKNVYSKGLGLYFCKVVMQAHSGRIWVESDEKGNYFKLGFKKIKRLN